MYAGDLSRGPLDAMVFEPSMEEFKDFPKYIKWMEKKFADKSGIAKVIPPTEWSPRPDMPEDFSDTWDIEIPRPVEQIFCKRRNLNCYTMYRGDEQEPLIVRDFIELSKGRKYMPPFSEYVQMDDIARCYWETIRTNPPIYGAGVERSLYQEGVREWNIKHLDTFLDLLHVDGEQVDSIECVNTAFLYFGMWKTTFPWHVEDMNLYSINYLHEGAPKVWYGIPASHKADFEELARSLYAMDFADCLDFLRHKACVIPLELLVEKGIPYSTMTHRKGEFMITFPGGYHAGFNTGYNIAESTNFGSTKWIKMGNSACTVSICSVCHDLPRFDMEAFNDKYETLTCDICLAVFTQEGALKRHKRIHSGDKPFECIECEKTFTQSDQLQVHIRTHTGEKLFTCEVCEESFTAKASVAKHVNRWHTVAHQPFKCSKSMCGNEFPTKYELKNHIRTVH